MISVSASVSKTQMERWERRVQREFGKRIYERVSEWGDHLFSVIDGLVSAEETTAEMERAGNFEWDQDYASPHSRGGKSSVAVSKAIRWDSQITTVPHTDRNGIISIGAGNVDFLNRISPHWGYYEYGSVRSYRRGRLMNPEWSQTFRQVYKPKFRLGRKFGRITVRYIWFAEEKKGRRRLGALIPAESLKPGAPQVALAEAWKRGTPGKKIYSNAQILAWRHIRSDAKKFAKEFTG